MKTISPYAVFICISLLFSEVSVTAARRKLIIDTDVGGDDAVALLLALMYEKSLGKSTDFEIVAITCVFGNTYEPNVEKNVLKTLSVANRSDIPVYGGSRQPLIIDYEGSNFFGNDGLGDFEFKEKIIGKIDKSKSAPLALTEIVRQNPGEITVLCLGPLTNIATAIVLDRTFAENVKELVVMGGSVYGVGNHGPNVEFNFAQDPESNFIVFSSNTRQPITLFPWETALKYSPSKDFRINIFGKRKSKLVEFLNKAERVYVKNEEDWTVVDAMATAVMLWPELITEYFTTNVTPVIEGPAKGTILVDYPFKSNKRNNTKIIQAYNMESFKSKLLKYIY